MLETLAILVFVGAIGCLGLLGTAGTALAVLMIVQSVQRKGRMGINLRLEKCPRCGRKVPAFRVPTSLRQGLWGGWTCQGCGAEMDKWGKELPG